MSTEARSSPHTSGPWRVSKFNSMYVVAENGMQLARCSGSPGGEGEANARLIAAAPDMLEALRMIADIGEASQSINSLAHIAKIARATLAKVEGE